MQLLNQDFSTNDSGVTIPTKKRYQPKIMGLVAFLLSTNLILQM
jgi:hypothetical protein